MPALADYLSSLYERGVRLWIDGSQLRYHARKGILSAQELAQLRVMREEIVCELSQRLPGHVEPTEPGAGASPGPAPLSLQPASVQQRWLSSLMQQRPDWPRAQAFAFQLTGALDLRILELSIQAVCRRHDLLSAQIVDTGRCFELEACAPQAYRFEVVSAVDDSCAGEERNGHRHISELIAQCVEPTGGLLYTRLLQVSEQQHYLVLVVHRLAADCLAIAQIFRELWILYSEALAARSSPALAESTQYHNYALRQQSTEGEWQRKHGPFWQERLLDAPGLQWPDGASTLSDSLAEVAFLQGSFGKSLSLGLRELARQMQSLPSLVVLTLYVFVVSRWCGQEDFILPFNVAGRHAAHEGVVGPFSHILYLRITLKADEPFHDLLRKVSNVFYKAVFHQDCGRMALQYPHLLRGTLCQWLSWHPTELSGQEMYEVPAQLGIVVKSLRFQTARDLANVPPGVTDLDVSFFESAGDIGMLLIFSRKRFAASTLERFMRELRISADQIVSDSRRRPSG